MGKLNHHPYITHFSHPHPLELCNLDLPNNQTHYSFQSSSCSACCLPHSSGYIYTCKSCPGFSLHLPCSQMPPSITHPSHPYHPLSLSPVSTYPGGKFSCDACKLHSGGFSYHCATCSFDLHIKCAIKPLTMNHRLHPHPLDLTFNPPYGGATGFSCDVCRHVGTSHWLYRCAACEFDVHLECPPAPVRPQPPAHLIHQQSMPVPPLKLQQSTMPPLIHQQSMPAIGVTGPRPQMQYNNYYAQPQQQGPTQAPIMQSQRPPPLQAWQAQTQPPIVQSQRPPVQAWQGPAAPAQQGAGQMYNNPAAANQSMGNMIMQAAVQGFVEGAAQQAGQTFVQDVILDDGSNNNNGGDFNSGAGDQVDCGSY